MGQVRDLAALYVDQRDVGIVPSAVDLVVAKEIFAVRAPLEALVAVSVGVIHAFKQRLFLSVLGRFDDQFGPVAQERHPFPVRRDNGLEACLAFRCHKLFLELGGIGEPLFLLVGQRSLVYSPMTVPFR